MVAGHQRRRRAVGDRRGEHLDALVDLLEVLGIREKARVQRDRPPVGEPLAVAGEGELAGLAVPVPGAVVVPGEEVPAFVVGGAVEDEVLRVGVVVGHQHVDRQPGDVVGAVEVLGDDVVDVLAHVVDRGGHLLKLADGRRPFRLHQHGELLGIGRHRRIDRLEGERLGFVERPLGIEPVGGEEVGVRLFQPLVKPVVDAVDHQVHPPLAQAGEVGNRPKLVEADAVAHARQVERVLEQVDGVRARQAAPVLER